MEIKVGKYYRTIINGVVTDEKVKVEEICCYGDSVIIVYSKTVGISKKVFDECFRAAK